MAIEYHPLIGDCVLIRYLVRSQSLFFLRSHSLFFAFSFIVLFALSSILQFALSFIVLFAFSFVVISLCLCVLSPGPRALGPVGH